jgi:hypothetical protein
VVVSARSTVAFFQPAHLPARRDRKPEARFLRAGLRELLLIGLGVGHRERPLHRVDGFLHRAHSAPGPYRFAGALVVNDFKRTSRPFSGFFATGQHVAGVKEQIGAEEGSSRFFKQHAAIPAMRNMRG